MFASASARVTAIRVALALAMLGLLTPSTQAAWDTNITNIVDDATEFFTSIKGVVIIVVVFGVAIGFAKLLKKK